MANRSVIMAILQETRVETASKVQDILTQYGCFIRVRLGLHDSGLQECTNTGIILLQLCGEELPVVELERKLTEIENVKVKYMTLDF